MCEIRCLPSAPGRICVTPGHNPIASTLTDMNNFGEHMSIYPDNHEVTRFDVWWHDYINGLRPLWVIVWEMSLVYEMLHVTFKRDPRWRVLWALINVNEVYRKANTL